MTKEKREDGAGRKWDAKKYEGIFLYPETWHFWFFKNQKELKKWGVGKAQGVEMFYSLEDFENYEDWVYEMNSR